MKKTSQLAPKYRVPWAKLEEEKKLSSVAPNTQEVSLTMQPVAPDIDPSLDPTCQFIMWTGTHFIIWPTALLYETKHRRSL